MIYSIQIPLWNLFPKNIILDKQDLFLSMNYSWNIFKLFHVIQKFYDFLLTSVFLLHYEIMFAML